MCTENGQRDTYPVLHSCGKNYPRWQHKHLQLSRVVGVCFALRQDPTCLKLALSWPSSCLSLPSAWDCRWTLVCPAQWDLLYFPVSLCEPRQMHHLVGTSLCQPVVRYAAQSSVVVPTEPGYRAITPSVLLPMKGTKIGSQGLWGSEVPYQCKLPGPNLSVLTTALTHRPFHCP